MKSDTFANRYKILETIGRGGMGVVYKATDLMLDKTVALKVLSEKISDQAALRFQTEAKAAGMLNHPNIVLVLDFGVSEDGEPYMVLEYIAGVSLADLLKPSGLTLERSLEIFRQICRALAQAHERGIIHRDIKPSNVIVATDEDSAPFAKLTDFGIAKLVEADQGLTSTGAMIGSPLYMSPEQVRGESLDVRSDIYSLGCLMYETLCGQPPLKGETQLETARMCQSVEPPPLSTVAGQSLPSELETIVGKCLRKDRNKRYQKVSELLSDLNSVSTPIEITQPEIEEEVAVIESTSPQKSTNTTTLLAVPFFLLLAIGLFYFTSVLLNSSEPVDTKTTSSDVEVSALGLGASNSAAGEELEAAAKIDSKNHPTEADKAPDSLELKNGDTIAHLYNASPAGLKKICQLHRKIHEMEVFGGTTFDGTQLKSLALLPKLRYLKMTDVPLKDENLSELVGLDQLDRIKLEYIDSVRGPGLAYVARLRKLHEFGYMRTNLTDPFLTHLQKLPVPKLSLKGCRGITKERMRIFRNMPRLKSLVLHNTLLHDDMLTPLAGLKLKELILDQNSDLTEACFSTLKTMKKLERIGLNECPGISGESRRKLARELNLLYTSEIGYLTKLRSTSTE